MHIDRRGSYAWLLCVALAATGGSSCKKTNATETPTPGTGTPAAPVAAAAGFAQQNTPENLQAYFTELRRAALAGETPRAAGLIRSLIGDDARARLALRDDAPPAVLDGVRRMAAGMGDDASVVREFGQQPERSQVQVHGASTEEIAAYAQGSVAFNEFPGGARRAAQSVLRPGVRFFEVEVLEPGHDAGTKYHLFFWDGQRWTMLGAVWRSIPAAPAANPAM